MLKTNLKHSLQGALQKMPERLKNEKVGSFLLREAKLRPGKELPEGMHKAFIVSVRNRDKVIHATYYITKEGKFQDRHGQAF